MGELEDGQPEPLALMVLPDAPALPAPNPLPAIQDDPDDVIVCDDVRLRAIACVCHCFAMSSILQNLFTTALLSLATLIARGTVFARLQARVASPTLVAWEPPTAP